MGEYFQAEKPAGCIKIVHGKHKAKVDQVGKTIASFTSMLLIQLHRIPDPYDIACLKQHAPKGFFESLHRWESTFRQKNQQVVLK